LYNKLLVKLLICKPLWVKSYFYRLPVYNAGALFPCMHCGRNKVHSPKGLLGTPY